MGKNTAEDKIALEECKPPLRPNTSNMAYEDNDKKIFKRIPAFI